MPSGKSRMCTQQSEIQTTGSSYQPLFPSESYSPYFHNMSPSVSAVQTLFGKHTGRIRTFFFLKCFSRYSALCSRRLKVLFRAIEQGGGGAISRDGQKCHESRCRSPAAYFRKSPISCFLREKRCFLVSLEEF